MIIDDIPDDKDEHGRYTISSMETEAIDGVCQCRAQMDARSVDGWDKLTNHLSVISSTLSESNMARAMEERAEFGYDAIGIGELTAPYDDDPLIVTDASSSEEQSDGSNDELDKNDWMELETSDDLDNIFMSSAVDASNPRGVDAAHLSKIWRISHEDATRTLAATTQNSMRPMDPSLSQNYGTNDRMLRYRRINDYFFMDTLFATSKGGKSSRGNTCCQLFVTDKGFIYLVPLKRKSEVMYAVKQFAKEIGAPQAIICDMSGEQMKPDVKLFLNDIGTTLRALEEGTPWSNKADLYIKLMKEAVRKDMRESHSPLPFWDYCLERRVRIYNLTARDHPKIRGTNPYTMTMGEEGDISNLCQYKWYEWCYCGEHTAAFPHNQEVLGRVLGPARGEGNEMAQWVLKANGRVVPRRSVRPLHASEEYSPTEIKKRQLFDELIERRYGTSTSPPPKISKPNDDEFENYEDDDEPSRPVPEIEDMVDTNGRLLNQLPAYDRLLQAEVQMQLGEEYRTGKVT